MLAKKSRKIANKPFPQCPPPHENQSQSQISCNRLRLQYLWHKFKRHSKLHWNSHPIKNLLTFASGYLVKFCSFYPHLRLKTVFPNQYTQICCINMNISFLENWKILNHKLVFPLLLTYQAWKSNLAIWKNMKVGGIQKFQFSNSKVQSKLIFNNQYFIYFMNWKKNGKSN